MPLFDNK